MTSVVLLDPGCAFPDLDERYARAGWRITGRTAEPIVPGEPEYAVFERAADRVVYTFNPVCLLRVLDCAAVRDMAGLPDVPAVDAEAIRGWLATTDERTILRGLLAAGQLGDPGLAAAAGALAGHPNATIATLAARIAAELDEAATTAGFEGQLSAQAQALAAVEVLEQQLTPLLHSLARDRDGSLAAELRPRPGDYLRAFTGDAAETARAAYETLWARPPAVSRVPPGSRLECHVAPAGMLGYDNHLSRRFPGGYRAVAMLLLPQRVWVAWKLIEPGRAAGMAYDGLVWLDDHWAWFPKPYRVLRPR